MIDVSFFVEKLEALKDSFDERWKRLEIRNTYYMRIIYDDKVDFPDYYNWIDHDPLIELSNIPWDKHEKRGWSKPDVSFLGVELFYLWKNFK